MLYNIILFPKQCAALRGSYFDSNTGKLHLHGRACPTIFYFVGQVLVFPTLVPACMFGFCPACIFGIGPGCRANWPLQLIYIYIYIYIYIFLTVIRSLLIKHMFGEQVASRPRPSRFLTSVNQYFGDAFPYYLSRCLFIYISFNLASAQPVFFSSVEA